MVAVLVTDIIHSERRVELPERCTNPECGAELSADLIYQWNLQDRRFTGRIDPDTGDLETATEAGRTGELYLPVSYACFACGEEIDGLVGDLIDADGMREYHLARAVEAGWTA